MSFASTDTRAPRRASLRSCLMVAALALALFCLAIPAGAQTVAPAGVDFPALSGRVVDEADILPDRMRVDLISKLARLEAKTGDQVVVVTLRSLRGRSIEQYGVALGRRWQIGQKGRDNGVLLIVAPAERKVRIEVGYGLEGTLTDAVASYIIQQNIIPHFRDSDMAGGVARGADDIVQVLGGDAAAWQRRAAPFASHETGGASGVLVSLMIAAAGFALLVVLGFAFVRFLVLIGAVPKPTRRSGYSSSWSTSFSGTYGPSASLSSGGFSDGGFSGGGGSFGGGGASGSW
ncbi:MAG TPA: TPM domain-containing protein [Xanthobacteraceae bacterium]